VSVFIVSHDLAEIFKIADFVVRIEKGDGPDETSVGEVVSVSDGTFLAAGGRRRAGCRFPPRRA